MRKIKISNNFTLLFLIIPSFLYLLFFITSIIHNSNIQVNFISTVYYSMDAFVAMPALLYFCFFLFIILDNRLNYRYFFYFLLFINFLIQIFVVFKITNFWQYLYFVPHILLNIFLVIFSDILDLKI